MAVTHTFAGLPVSDFAAEYEWYVALFGREADMFPREGEAVWRLTSTGSVYVVGDPDRAGDGLLTLALADLDGQASRLREHGLTLTEQRGGGGPRRLAISDRDGNRITFFQDPAVTVG